MATLYLVYGIIVLRDENAYRPDGAMVQTIPGLHRMTGP